jgi:hypothetical protein
MTVEMASRRSAVALSTPDTAMLEAEEVGDGRAA